MPVRATKEQLTGDEQGTYSCEASDLGLKAGEWPELIEVDGIVFRKTGAIDYDRMEVDGEFIGFEYKATVKVFND